VRSELSTATNPTVGNWHWHSAHRIR